MHVTCAVFFFFFFNDTATTEIYTLSLHDVFRSRWSPYLLHVDVDQLTAAGGVDPADDPARRAVHPSELVHSVAHEDPVHRRGRNTDDPGKPGRTQLAGLT